MRIDLSFNFSLPTKFLIIESCGLLGMAGNWKMLQIAVMAMSRSNDRLNCWFTNGSILVQILCVVKALQSCSMYISVDFICAIVSRAILIILIHYPRLIVGNSDNIVNRVT